MTILFFLIPLTLILLSFAVWAFFWAVKNDQFDDLEGPAYRILFDEDENDLPIEQRSQNKANVKPDMPDEQPAPSSDNQAAQEKNS